MNPFIKEYYDKYKDKLDGYTYITHENLYIMKPGGLIKFINLNGELKGGGILLQLLNTSKYTTLKFLMKISPEKIYSLSYSKNYIFYSPQVKDRLKKQLKVILVEK
jgi:hypothetical protein